MLGSCNGPEVQESHTQTYKGEDAKRSRTFWGRLYGRFPEKGHPNIEPKIRQSLLLGPPQRYI